MLHCPGQLFTVGCTPKVPAGIGWHPKYGRLALGALRALSVSASSAPVERVFSYGGIFMRQYRA